MTRDALERGSKAETLLRLAVQLRHAHVPRLVYWRVDEWDAARDAIVATVAATFAGARVAVRSATRDEDAPGSGLAGRFRTVLDVSPAPAALIAAVEEVIASYPADTRTSHHVLVQAMVTDVRRSGVVLTRDPETGAAYDVIELATGGATDAVTAGRARPTRVAVYRGARPAAIARAGVASVVAVAREVEALGGGGGLDLELAERQDGTIALLQARALHSVGQLDPRGHARVAATLADLAATVTDLDGPRPGLAGQGTVLGQMPDWNPAELIGAHPAPLAAALFRVLLGDAVWHEARAHLGYRGLPPTALVHLLAGRPYVDTRASFNSWLPPGLPATTNHALVDAWLARLRAHPELHDRVELEVAQTALDLDTARTYASRFGAPLAPQARDDWLAALRALTIRLIDLGPDASLPAALRAMDGNRGSAGASDPSSLRAILQAIAWCRHHGAYPFAIVARHAFVAEGLLRSMVARKALTPERLIAFRRSFTTVAGELTAAWARVAEGTISLEVFLGTFGHLRPGAFDITSRPYRRRDPDLWRVAPAPAIVTPFVPTSAERGALGRLLAEAGLPDDVDRVLAWTKAAVAGRESAKFRFTRRLSAALETLAEWGERRGFSRDDLAHLDLDALAAAAERGEDDAAALAARVAAARAARAEERRVRLGPLLRDADDLFVVHEPPVVPTFITDRTVVAPPVHLDGPSFDRRAIRGSIVCLEQADPGFDWLFGRGVGGLVTRFGGANSHMAIRCTELWVPAALGVGEEIFARVRAARVVELRCAERALRCAGPEPACAR